jgi:hypothetical protein
MSTDELKLTFVRQAVERYGADVIAVMERSIRKNRKVDTEGLLGSLDHSAQGTTSGAVGRILFNRYGRYVDMGVGRGHRLGGGIEKLQAAILASQGRDRFARPVRKPVKIYSPIAYGKLNGLIEDIAYGFTKETITRLRAELEASQPST